MKKFFVFSKLAFEGILAHKFRAFLSTLSVAIGVFAVIMMTAVGEGAKQQIEKEFSSFGTDMFFVVPGKIDIKNLNFNTSQSLDLTILTEEDVKALGKIENVEYVSPITIVGGLAFYNNKPAQQAFILSVYPQFFKMGEYKLLEGRIFDENEVKNKKPVCVLGINAKNDLFGQESALGKKITIKGKNFEVVGVLDKSPIAFRMFGVDFDNIVYLPFGSSQIINNEKPRILRILVKNKDGRLIDQTIQKAKDELLILRNGEENFTILKQEDVLKILDSITNVLIALVSAIAAISLFVGGIGIMNIMLVSVSERVKEIGLRKAIGARKSDILLQFLTEAIFITVLGGILGILGGVGVSRLISLWGNFSPVVSVKYAFLAIFGCFLVGLFFGILPAMKAANLNPIEALRHE